MLARRLLVATACAFLACGSDYAETPSAPAPATTAPAQGALDGACYPNSTCNDGLTCAVVTGVAKCRPSEATTPNDAGSDASDATTVADASDPRNCQFNAKMFPCEADKPVACFGDLETCTVAGGSCAAGLVRWECISPKNCAPTAGKLCCLHGGDFDPDTADLTSCTVADISVRSSDTHCQDVCGDDLVRMCASTTDCLADERCKPFRAKGDPSILEGQILGICVK